MLSRRAFGGLLGGLAGGAGLPAWAQSALERPFDPDELPFPTMLVAGDQALATWERLKAEGKGWPVILGDALHGSHLLDSLSLDDRPPADLIAAANAISFPADLRAIRATDRKALLDDLRKNPDGIAYHELKPGETGDGRPVTNAEALKAFDSGEELFEIGDWPTAPEVYPPLGSILHHQTGKPVDKVHIALLPTIEGATAPAWLKFGGWNDCPPIEHQIAALRSLHDRYGAELVCCTHDTIDLRLARLPGTPEEALGLARELYDYCADSIDQGHETLSRFAAALMASDWWTFWWD